MTFFTQFLHVPSEKLYLIDPFGSKMTSTIMASKAMRYDKCYVNRNVYFNFFASKHKALAAFVGFLSPKQ